jgi:DNA-binding MarR family transcriptional regulator
MQDERLRSSIPNAIVRLFRLVNRVANRRLKPTGVSAEQAHVLLLLDTLGPMTIGQLQRLLALSSPTLTGAIDRLEAMELVRRVPSPDDGRAFLIEPRLPARKRTQIDRAVEDAERQCFGALDARERKELLRLLDKCITHVEASETS